MGVYDGGMMKITRDLSSDKVGNCMFCVGNVFECLGFYICNSKKMRVWNSVGFSNIHNVFVVMGSHEGLQ